MKALLIIDMQKESFTEKTPRWDSRSLVNRINTLIEYFHNHNFKIIFIQHDGSKDGYCLPQSKDWEILDELSTELSNKIISKTANDAFYKSKLQAYLNEYSITDLVMTGCATDFCVDSTVKSALNMDFNVTVISDGHTTADRNKFKSSDIVNYYNWVWSELIPTEGKIEVISTKEFIKI